MKNYATVLNDAFPPSREAIMQRARELWEDLGRPEGRDEEIWLLAERQLLGEDSPKNTRHGLTVPARQLDEPAAKPGVHVTPTERPNP